MDDPVIMSKKTERAVSLLSYGLIVMAVSHMLTHVFGGIHPAIFSILRDEFNLSLQQLGVIAAIPPLCQSILSIPTGLLSDRLGSRRPLLLSFTIAIIGALLASQASNPATLIVALSLVFINTTIYHPASYSFTAKLFKAGDRSKALGLQGAGGTLGHAFGPLSVSILIGLLAFEWRQVYLLLALPMLLGLFMVLRLKEDAYSEVTEIKNLQSVDVPTTQTLFTTSMVMYLVSSALRSMGGSMISNFIVLYLQDVKDLSIMVASFIFSGSTLTGILAAPLGGFIASKFGDKKWLLSTLFVGYFSLGLSIILPNTVWFVFLYLVYGLCNTLCMASRASVMAKLTPRRQQGLGYSLFFLPRGVMGAVAPVIAGFIADHYGFNPVFYFSLVLYFISLLMIKFLVKVD